MSSMLLAAAAAAVNPPPTLSADQALTNADKLYSVTPPKTKSCPTGRTVQSGNEIVVCRQREDPTKQYVPSDVDNGAPDDGGVPRAPAVTMLPNGGTIVVRGCFIPPCPKPPALIIDVKAIPEPPKGSDADKMSRGEIPTP